MRQEIKLLYKSLYIPLLIVVISVIIKLSEEVIGTRFSYLGVYPREFKGLVGILLSPLIHGDWGHIFSNAVPLLVLGTSLFYFYRGISFKIFGYIWLLSGIFVWISGRASWHIGASGIVYGLFAFILLSAILRKRKDLIAIAFIAVFLYGSMIWGIFPDFYPDKNISFEGHTGGLISGVLLAIIYRKSGPQPIVYDYEEEEEDEDDEQIDSDSMPENSLDQPKKSLPDNVSISY